MNDDRDSLALTELLRRRGPMPAAALQQALGVSRATLSRWVANAGSQVQRLGAARATVYATARQIAGRSSWPLYRIGPEAKVEVLGELQAIGPTQFALRPEHPLPALAPSSDHAAGIHPDLPWFLDDLRPQGFLGRHFARRWSTALGLPADLTRWNGDHVIQALTQVGEDAIGDLVLGEASLEQAQAGIDQPAQVLQPDDRAQAYPRLAEAALLGAPVGSSAGGEQQKFTTTLATADGFAPLIVKFTDASGNPVGARWASLLRGEALAADVLNRHGLAAAANRVLAFDDRVFLESPRFDRTACLGRRGQVSLSALGAAWFGVADQPWWQLASQLLRSGWIGADDARDLQRMYWFGALIGNSDMHLGNVSLVLTDKRPLRLCPVYDMLPMQWRPTAQGSLPERSLTVVAPAPGQLEAWHWAATAASEFWTEYSADPNIDASLRNAAEMAAERVGRARQRFS
ncbi:MAG: type II toxin-antitoxin system HipA family toxin YjjJ [Xanthomonadales bacterium]|nr:type II toxin-antitoxin system HipA family toxin YjjJ [Xanthomonadales bacterium]MCB1634204.1 type II toxin-antitoxin system HipA family toxin YjjJ [Xanthomonadales bacterium]